MIETKTMSKPEEESESKPCIFGAGIKNPCPVRMELKNADPMEKYIKSTKKPEFEELMDAAQDLMNKIMAKEWMLLHEFCAVCPFLSIFEEKNIK